MNRLLIVGDDYERFAQQDLAVTVSEFRRRAATGVQTAERQLFIGQGVSVTDRATILEEHKAHAAPIEPLASLEQTHKRERDHVLITAPTRVAPNTYNADVLINEVRDRLSDHVTGQHLGGMLLIEAARQACIAALDGNYPQHNWGLAWGHLDVRFAGYAFPLPISLSARIQAPDDAKLSQMDITVVVDLFQAQRSICVVTFAITLIDNIRLAALEARRARQALEGFCKPRVAEVPAEVAV